MYQLLLGLYILVCLLLVLVILMQSGRGGGLVESFSAADTLFGGKTNIYMVRITMVLGGLFLLFALGLNYFVVQKSKSVVERLFQGGGNSPQPLLPEKKTPQSPQETVSNPVKDGKDKETSSQLEKTIRPMEQPADALTNSIESKDKEAPQPLTQPIDEASK